MKGHWVGVTVDCHDVDLVAGFWSKLLDRDPGPSRPGWVYLGERGDTLPRLVFQPVPETKQLKNRVHLDILVDDIDAGMDQIRTLGGSFTGERHDYEAGVIVIAQDPEGNEFCLVQYYQ
ncbi:putative enzyme related to lactoylglutathione lyase [Kribbella amoyensis]|uniref:Putative enzyme related to lactoylglutathione lyase n=1 Tax=Kribbella amoyensis TaxID=996641 RepID=A0A561C0P7_9ACTN|nr:VOC family protein [Kribbella amoyensis]TWD84648.1 putative enzyme related to lactoylglutathione lyase [Kribbella amoyensis]